MSSNKSPAGSIWSKLSQRVEAFYLWAVVLTTIGAGSVWLNLVLMLEKIFRSSPPARSGQMAVAS